VLLLLMPTPLGSVLPMLQHQTWQTATQQQQQQQQVQQQAGI
jgi:hypothetical protein